MDLGIDGRVAAVGGASAGLGFETARALAADGVIVAIASRDAARIEAAAKQIGERAVPIVADLSTPEGARAFIAEAGERVGPPDILIANSGGPPPGAAADTDLATLRSALDHCFVALMELCQAAVPTMRERGFGRVVAITTLGVAHPLPNMIYSNTARAAFTAYLATLAREVAGDGVTVNSLLPGPHETERLRSMIPADAIGAIGAANPTGRIGSAEDFGHVAAFLCSRWANYITGSAIPIGGGASAI